VSAEKYRILKQELIPTTDGADGADLAWRDLGVVEVERFPHHGAAAELAAEEHGEGIYIVFEDGSFAVREYHVTARTEFDVEHIERSAAVEAPVAA
jgi:hypothetical protein